MDVSPTIAKRFKAMPGAIGYMGLIIVGVLSEGYCGAAPLAFEAIGIGAILFTAFLIIGFGVLPTLRRNISATVVVLSLFVPVAALIGLQAIFARRPESIYQRILGSVVPQGITNLHAKAVMGPMGGGAGLYFEADWTQQEKIARQFDLVPEGWDSAYTLSPSQALALRATRWHLPAAEFTNPARLTERQGRQGHGHREMWIQTNQAATYFFYGY